MNKSKAIVVVLFAATAALAAMGCWFCWQCPSRIYPPEAHGLFWRQLAWNGVGLSVFAAAWLVGWKRLLKAAPWLMAAWFVAIAVAQFSSPVNGARKWLSIGSIRVNVMTCFMPVFALFVAWLYERKWIRPWMAWAAVAAAAIGVVWHIAGNAGRMARLAAFLNLGGWMPDRVYMSRQLLAAFDVSKWFGAAGRSLGFLPCPESDGMMSAAALIFGKWFPSVLVGLFSAIGAILTLLWKAEADVPKRRFVLLFGLWLMAPAAYCFLHSLAFLPVAGLSPALASYGGTAVALAWFGCGSLAAMSRGGVPENGSDIRTAKCFSTACAWGAVAGLAVLLMAFAPKREFWMSGGDLKFAEPRPSDLEFGEFGLEPRRGRILASDGSVLADSKREWQYYFDCELADVGFMEAEDWKTIAEGLELPLEELFAGYLRVRGDSGRRHVLDVASELGLQDLKSERLDPNSPIRCKILKTVPESDPANDYFERNRRWLQKIAGICRRPIQKRTYALGDAATAVVGFMGCNRWDGAALCGADGIEYACDGVLAGVGGIYDRTLPLKERRAKATPKAGADVQTTLVPQVQKALAAELANAGAACGAAWAWGIVMKVPSGEIAAMASWPTFDPVGPRNCDKWDVVGVNHAVHDCFELGGLIQPVVRAIALDAGSPADSEAICREIGSAKFHAALKRFGFGAPTGTKGIVGEENGILVSDPRKWDKATTGVVDKGYGFAATALQLVQAYAAVANQGVMVRPVLVRTDAADGESGQVVSPRSADEVMRTYEGPVVSSVRMCDRDPATGRGVYSPTNHIASCAGFVPSGRPEYVVAVSFAKPCGADSGKDAAAKAFRALEGGLD